MRRDLPNKDTAKSSQSEFIDPNTRHSAASDYDAEVRTAAKASRRKKTALAPRKSTASEDPNDYFERAAHLYGQTEARRIVANTPYGSGSTLPGGADREAGN